MGRIDTYPENTSIEDNDKLLTYDTSASATRNTPFSRLWPWIQSKLNALTKQTAIASTDQLLMVKDGNTTGRIDYNVLAKAIIEQYNSSALAGSNQTLKQAIDALNSKNTIDIPSANINSKITTSSAYLRKTKFFAEILLEGSANADISAWEQLLTGLPNGYRPYQSNNAFFISINDVINCANMNSVGVINTPAAITSGQRIRFRAVYMINS